MATATKLSEPMIAALAGVYNSATPGKKNTMEALESRGLIAYKSGQVVITQAGREAIDAPISLVGVQECGTVLYGSVQAYLRAMEAQEIQEELNTNMWDDPEVTEEEVQAFTSMLDNLDSGTEWDTYRDDWAEWEKELAGFGETSKWSNTSVWNGLTAKEIRADIRTASTDNRKDRRELARIQNNVSRHNWFKMSGQSRKQAKICGGKG
jgi:hypothetical protein